MSKLEDITVSVEPPSSPSQVLAILNELQFKLKVLNEQGCSDSIDLRTLPLFPGDYEQLKQTLGHGEIHVSIDAMGPTEIYETAIAGIWWVTHYNSQEENVAEYIEITTLPELLRTSHEDIKQAEQHLQQLIANYDHNLNHERGESDEAG
jgi:hydrogenase-1 operon protein HyaF